MSHVSDSPIGGGGKEGDVGTHARETFNKTERLCMCDVVSVQAKMDERGKGESEQQKDKKRKKSLENRQQSSIHYFKHKKKIVWTGRDPFRGGCCSPIARKRTKDVDNCEVATGCLLC